jgi:hypothetical protein
MYLERAGADGAKKAKKEKKPSRLRSFHVYVRFFRIRFITHGKFKNTLWIFERDVNEIFSTHRPDRFRSLRHA